MSQFKNVNVVRKANIYFDGKVTSRTVQFPKNETKTLGIMLPGEYRFGTDKQELMEIQSGEVAVLLADEHEWRHYTDGDSFTVKGNSSFQINVLSVTDYCCSFID